MTVINQSSATELYSSGNDRREWPFEFRVFDARDINIILTDVSGRKRVVTSGIRVTMSVDPNVEMGVAVWPTAPTPALPAGYTVQVVRNTPLKQTSKLAGSGYSGELAERTADRLVMLIQELQRIYVNEAPSIYNPDNITVPVNIDQGGTGSTTLEGARKLLGIFGPEELIDLNNSVGEAIANRSPQINSRSDFPSVNIPSPVFAVIVHGYAVPGDAPAARYIRDATNGSGPMAVKSKDGAWWCLDLSLGEAWAEWFGADRSCTRDCAPAFDLAGAALMAVATKAGKVLRVGGGRFLFERRSNILIYNPNLKPGDFYNGITIIGMGQWNTKFVPSSANAEGIFKISYTQASSVVRLESFSITSLLRSNDAANVGRNNGYGIWTTKTDGTPDNPLASLMGYNQVYLKDINFHGDDQDEGVAVGLHGLWRMPVRIDYAWVPTLDNVDIRAATIPSYAEAETLYRGLNAVSRAAGTGLAGVLFYGCYDPQFLQNCKISMYAEAGAHYFGTTRGPGIGQRKEGGSFILPEISSVLDCVVIDEPWDIAVTGSITAGSTTVTNVTSSAGIYGGWLIEGAGIPRATTAAVYNPTARTITLSKPATATIANGTFNVTNESSIAPDEVRFVGGQLAPLRHGIKIKNFQDVWIDGTTFFQFPRQFDPNEPLPASIYLHTASDIRINSCRFGSGYAANLTPGPNLNASVSLRVEGASTGIQISDPQFAHDGISIYANTIPSAGPQSASGLQRSITVSNGHWGGRTGGNVTQTLRVYDPSGVVALQGIEQTTTVDQYDIVSNIASSDATPVHRNRRIRSDYVSSVNNVTLGRYAFTGVDNSGAEQTFAAIDAVGQNTSANAAVGGLSVKLRYGTALRTVMTVDGNGSLIATAYRTDSTNPATFGNVRGAGFQVNDAGAAISNFLATTPAPAGFGPNLAPVGSDPNIDLNIYGKGTGTIAHRGPVLIAGLLSLNSPASLATYTVAAPPNGFNGFVAYFSNGRKVGEAAGAGTGVPAYFSNNAWRRLSDDTVVQA